MNDGDTHSADRPRAHHRLGRFSKGRFSVVVVVVGVLLAGAAGYQILNIGDDSSGERIEASIASTAEPDDSGNSEDDGEPGGQSGQESVLNVEVGTGRDAKETSSDSVVAESDDASSETDTSGSDGDNEGRSVNSTTATATATGDESTESTTQMSSTTQGQTATTRRTTTTARRTTTTGATTTSPPAGGNIVWVDSRASSGGDGSQSAPFNTIDEGVLAVRAGETLMIKGGEYREHVNPGYRMPKGTSSKRITMRNAPGERVVIKGRVILTDIEYWTITGINVTWDSERNDRSVEHMVILRGGTDWEFRDAEVWGAKAYSAILVADDPRGFALRNLYVHDTYPTNDTNQDHLIYCACGTGGGVIERNLLVGSTNGRAVKLGTPYSSGEAIGNVVVRYNTMVDNYGPSNVQLSYNTSNITVERNIMVSTKDYAHNLSTYKLSGSNNRAANNIGYDSPGVVEPHGGIISGGGNLYRDPRLDSNYVPQDSASTAYGHKAP